MTRKKSITVLKILSYFPKLLLFFPIAWFAYIWIVLIFHCYITFPLFSISWHLMIFLGTKILFFLGSAYSFYKKYWGWFLIYCISGGFLVSIFSIFGYTPVLAYFMLNSICHYFYFFDA